MWTELSCDTLELLFVSLLMSLAFQLLSNIPSYTCGNLRVMSLLQEAFVYFICFHSVFHIFSGLWWWPIFFCWHILIVFLVTLTVSVQLCVNCNNRLLELQLRALCLFQCLIYSFFLSSLCWQFPYFWLFLTLLRQIRCTWYFHFFPVWHIQQFPLIGVDHMSLDLLKCTSTHANIVWSLPVL